jgi:hypothetical protein
VAAVSPLATDDREPQLRAILNASDRLLDHLEELRLADQIDTPHKLQEAIQALECRLGATNQSSRGSTLEAAHDLVFAVQERLLALRQNRPTPRGHPGRAQGSPIVTKIGLGQSWKVLSFPPRAENNDQDDEGWEELVLATLERALDRWNYAQHHSQRAVRRGAEVAVSLERARAAWENCWELFQEAERLGIIKSSLAVEFATFR